MCYSDAAARKGDRPLEVWERAFADKSQRRRRRSRRNRFIRRAAIFALISLATVLGLWLVNASIEALRLR